MVADEELPDVLTPAEIAGQERIHYKTVVGWCEQGKLRAYQMGSLWRIRRVDYLAFRKHNRRPDPTPEPAPPTRRQRIGGPSRQRAADRALDKLGV